MINHYQESIQCSSRHRIFYYFTDRNGIEHRYNMKVAKKFGRTTAVILEHIRSFNKKNNTKCPYSSNPLTGRCIAKDLSISQKTYWKYLKKLKNEGIISISKETDHYGKTNVYIVNENILSIIIKQNTAKSFWFSVKCDGFLRYLCLHP